MAQTTPRIHTVTPMTGAALGLMWRGGAADRVDLAGWIATGGDVLAPLMVEALFRQARVGEFGAAIVWGEEDGDLAIDAVHLEALAREQRPFTAADAAVWQREMGFSNQEAADLLALSLSSWNAYKAGVTPVPGPVAMLCRAARRDPIIVQAHLRPRRTGRPRKTA